MFVLTNVRPELALNVRRRFLVSYNHSHSMEKTMEYYTLNIVLWNV